MRAAAIALLLVSAQSASAFSVKETSQGAEVHWGSRRVDFKLISIGDRARDRLLHDAAKIAAAAWGEAGEVEIAVSNPTRTASVGFDDGHGNVIAWSNGDWMGDEDDLALTFMHYDAKTGAILDADIVMNDAHHGWQDATRERDPNAFDIANVMTHEMGHALGLDHSSVRDATMFASSAAREIKKRDLHDDDIEAISVLYARVAHEAPGAGPGGGGASVGGPKSPFGCQSVGAEGPTLVGLLGVLAMMRGRARHGRRARDGTG